MLERKLNEAKLPDCIIDIDATTESLLADNLSTYGVKRENAVSNFLDQGADHCKRGLTGNDLKEVKIENLGNNKFGFDCTTKKGEQYQVSITLVPYRTRGERYGY